MLQDTQLIKLRLHEARNPKNILIRGLFNNRLEKAMTRSPVIVVASMDEGKRNWDQTTVLFLQKKKGK